jgi:Fe-S-cluster containining protein
MSTIVDPCKDCGGCCRYFRVSFYFGEPVPEQLTTQVSPFLVCMQGTEHGHNSCIALTDNRCTIYEGRPSPCRDFPAIINGQLNPKCQEIKNKLNIM